MLNISENPAISLDLMADILNVSKHTLRRRLEKSPTEITPMNFIPHLLKRSELWEIEKSSTTKQFHHIELFCGGGGLMLGMEEAGFVSVLATDKDKDSCETIQLNRPDVKVLQSEVSKVRLSEYRGEVDLISGGFPCQPFSLAGNRKGFEDTRGTVFFEFARIIQEIMPKVILAENVKGLVNHDKGKTLEVIVETFTQLGYAVLPPTVLRAMLYEVPQKRERLFVVGIRNDLDPTAFKWPAPSPHIYTVGDALNNVPVSLGAEYSPPKRAVMSLVPEGGYWKDLPISAQKSYMGKSFLSGGGKTGVARRLSRGCPSLTLTCSPSQNQTERCHPTETRPLTIREYARIQSFPDDWQFEGSMNSQYRQIGNAVPPKLAAALGRSILRYLDGEL